MCLKNTRTNRTVSFRLQRLTVAQISFIFRHTARVLWLWVIRIGRPCLQVPYLDKIVTFPRLLPMRPLSSEINTESSLRCLPRFIRFSLESCKLICANHRKGTTLLMTPMLHFLCLVRLFCLTTCPTWSGSTSCISDWGGTGNFCHIKRVPVHDIWPTPV